MLSSHRFKTSTLCSPLAANSHRRPSSRRSQTRLDPNGYVPSRSRTRRGKWKPCTSHPMSPKAKRESCASAGEAGNPLHLHFTPGLFCLGTRRQRRTCPTKIHTPHINDLTSKFKTPIVRRRTSIITRTVQRQFECALERALEGQ